MTHDLQSILGRKVILQPKVRVLARVAGTADRLEIRCLSLHGSLCNGAFYHERLRRTDMLPML